MSDNGPFFYLMLAFFFASFAPGVIMACVPFEKAFKWYTAAMGCLGAGLFCLMVEVTTHELFARDNFPPYDAARQDLSTSDSGRRPTLVWGKGGGKR